MRVILCVVVIFVAQALGQSSSFYDESGSDYDYDYGSWSSGGSSYYDDDAGFHTLDEELNTDTFPTLPNGTFPNITCSNGSFPNITCPNGSFPNITCPNGSFPHIHPIKPNATFPNGPPNRPNGTFPNGPPNRPNGTFPNGPPNRPNGTAQNQTRPGQGTGGQTGQNQRIKDKIKQKIQGRTRSKRFDFNLGPIKVDTNNLANIPNQVKAQADQLNTLKTQAQKQVDTLNQAVEVAKNFLKQLEVIQTALNAITSTITSG